MPYIRTDKFIHPETLSADRVRHPFQVGARNAVVALLAVGVGGVSYLAINIGTNNGLAWWIWAVAIGGIVVACFAHAFLGVVIGGKRANAIFVALLTISLIGIVYWRSLVSDRTFRR